MTLTRTTLVEFWQIMPEVTSFHIMAIPVQQVGTGAAVSRRQALDRLADRIMVEDADLLRELARR